MLGIVIYSAMILTFPTLVHIHDILLSRCVFYIIVFVCLYLSAGLLTAIEKRLGRFFGFSPMCRSVSVGFQNKTEKNGTETERFSVGFSVGFTVKPGIKSLFQRIQGAFVGITCDDRIVWCQEQIKSM